VISSVELALTLVLARLPRELSPWQGALNAVLLVSVVLPVVYAVWYRPLNREIQARALAHRELERQALHDPITWLPNRVLFLERVRHEIEIAKRSRSQFSLAVLDLREFKMINSTLGHEVGDRLLALVGTRLRQGLRESDTVSRLGADLFGLVLRTVGPQAAPVAVDKVLALMLAPFHIDGVPVEIEALIGAAFYPEHGDDPDLLLRRAEMALHEAKEGGESYVLYHEADDAPTRRRLMMFGWLRTGVQREELRLHYQPKVDLKSGEIVGAEALVRWNSPDLGLVSPSEFIPLAEQTSLIRPLTTWVLGEAFRQLGEWHGRKMEISLAVNLSARSLSDDKLLGQLAELLETSRVAPECVTMEVTESGVMANPERAARILERLRGLGFGLSIDDFGTGYSSLNYVRTLPACELKLDRSFVRDIDTNTSNAAIVRAVVDLAHGLGLKVVAEGVETRADADAVRALGCDLLQGYYVSRPLPAVEFERFFQAYPESAVAQHMRAAPKPAELGKGVSTGPSAPPPGLRESLRLVRR